MKPSVSIMIGHGLQDPRAKQSGLMAALGSHDSSDDSAEPSDDEKYEAGMSDFIDAVHSKDVHAAAEAFKDLMVLCPDGGSEKHEDDEDYISGGEHGGFPLDDPS